MRSDDVRHLVVKVTDRFSVNKEISTCQIVLGVWTDMLEMEVLSVGFPHCKVTGTDESLRTRSLLILYF